MNNMESMKKLLPFLTNEELDDLLKKVLASPSYIYKDVTLKDLLVFLPTKDIDELYLNELKKGNDATYFLPFVSHETLKNIVELYCNDKLEYKIDVYKLAPFLDQDDIKLLYNYFLR